MATSQNGWPAGDRNTADVATFAVPGYPNVKLPVNRTAAPALLAMARWWFDNIEKPVIPGSWGYAYRAIRGSTETSNHASGTAIDINAPKHPLGAYGTVPAGKRAAISATARRLGLRWGGDYSGRKDEMHFEVIVTKARMREIAGALKGGKVPNPPASGGGSSGGGSGRPTLKYGSRGPNVRTLQQHMNRVYPAYSKLAVDGIYGNATAAVVKEFQRRSGIAVDGIVGPNTWRALGFK